MLRLKVFHFLLRFKSVTSKVLQRKKNKTKWKYTRHKSKPFFFKNEIKTKWCKNKTFLSSNYVLQIKKRARINNKHWSHECAFFMKITQKQWEVKKKSTKRSAIGKMVKNEMNAMKKRNMQENAKQKWNLNKNNINEEKKKKKQQNSLMRLKEKRERKNRWRSDEMALSNDDGTRGWNGWTESKPASIYWCYPFVTFSFFFKPTLPICLAKTNKKQTKSQQGFNVCNTEFVCRKTFDKTYCFKWNFFYRDIDACVEFLYTREVFVMMMMTMMMLIGDAVDIFGC